jgi:hypothetical protein
MGKKKKKGDVNRNRKVGKKAKQLASKAAHEAKKRKREGHTTHFTLTLSAQHNCCCHSPSY